ncbi:aspartyl/asparaginyl beta-hydroxylase domain-containing protein [Niveispirillum sp. KHB5.9]|uniref:aspartyl/asparaginyl beta-hydroxylase domain-containing protein n=1 Tax=Niveispirillum sp. KHB5.9 TaxID=3400269 RepID=UPI003A83B534
MFTRSNDPTPHARAGAEALKRGDFAGAKAGFGQAVAMGAGDLGTLLGLAYGCRGVGDAAGMVAALDRVLGIDPRNVRALILKGDHFGAGGDHKAATSFYRNALRAAPPAAQLPPDLVAELRRVQEATQDYARRFEEHLLSSLKGAGFGAEMGEGRFGRSLDILFGRRQVYYQQPQAYLFPELPQMQFYDRAAFPWLEGLEAQTDAIREELLAVMEGPDAFQPYLEASADRAQVDRSGLRGSRNWSAFYLWKNGEAQVENQARCPRTVAALEGIPLAGTRGRAPSVLFSLLKPGTHIPAHTGFVNTRLICHLPLIVPGKCRFRVGNEMREWQTGKAWVFDDTVEHEAWNDSDQTRVVLLFDVWRPELTLAEREMVSAMLTAIDEYGAGSGDWGA